MTSTTPRGPCPLPSLRLSDPPAWLPRRTTEPLAELARVTDLQWHLFREYDAKRGAR